MGTKRPNKTRLTFDPCGRRNPPSSMANQKYYCYAVRKGNLTGVFFDWYVLFFRQSYIDNWKGSTSYWRSMGYNIPNTKISRLWRRPWDGLKRLTIYSSGRGICLSDSDRMWPASESRSQNSPNFLTMSTIATPRRDRTIRAHPYHCKQESQGKIMTPAKKLLNKHLLALVSDDELEDSECSDTAVANLRPSDLHMLINSLFAQETGLLPRQSLSLADGIHTRLSTNEDACLAHQYLEEIRLEVSLETLENGILEHRLLKLVNEVKRAQQKYDRCNRRLAVLRNDAGLWRAVLRGNGICKLSNCSCTELD